MTGIRICHLKHNSHVFCERWCRLIYWVSLLKFNHLPNRRAGGMLRFVVVITQIGATHFAFKFIATIVYFIKNRIKFPYAMCRPIYCNIVSVIFRNFPILYTMIYK